MIDAEGPLGGGPLEPLVLGIFSSGHADVEFQAVNQMATGWAPESSTVAYIQAQYKNFDRPIQAYVDDMVVHELGHLYFGFCLTRIPADEADWWFPIGLGLLYDRMAWQEINKIESPLFSGTIQQWQRFAVLPVDQRLIHPDTRRDREFHLPRRQVYTHAKALIFLQALRASVGPARFDELVARLLALNVGKVLRYEDFLAMLSKDERADVDSIEREFHIR